MSTEIYRKNNLTIISFYGGEKRGKCIQITVGIECITLTHHDTTELAKKLMEWYYRGTFYDSQE